MKTDDDNGARQAGRTAVGPAVPPYPADLLTVLRDGGHIEALRSWGYRIGLAARDALVASREIELGVGDRASHVKAISDHFGLASGHHSLHVEPLGWLRLGETQATKGLQHFLADLDARMILFLQALAPTIVWPSDLHGGSVKPNAPAGNRGRAG